MMRDLPNGLPLCDFADNSNDSNRFPSASLHAYKVEGLKNAVTFA